MMSSGCCTQLLPFSSLLLRSRQSWNALHMLQLEARYGLCLVRRWWDAGDEEVTGSLPGAFLCPRFPNHSVEIFSICNYSCTAEVFSVLAARATGRECFEGQTKGWVGYWQEGLLMLPVWFSSSVFHFSPVQFCFLFLRQSQVVYTGLELATQLRRASSFRSVCRRVTICLATCLKDLS